jgi:alanine dehydrogenase
MNKKYFTISIIKEARTDENRTPFTPDQIQTLISDFPNLKILVQPSKNRCFKDEDYSKSGAKIEKDIGQSDVIFGIKEVEISKLIENKTYLFFSHTSKIRKDNSQATQNAAIIYKKKLLREVLKKKITLIDYENIRDESKNAYRYLGFGRFAGIVGCYNTLSLYLKLQKKQLLPRVFEINSYKKIKELISKQNFNKLKILQTGKGNVAKGSIEILKHANIKQISLNDYLNKKYDEAVFCNISLSEHVERNDGKDSSYQDFMLNPQEYKSKATNYLRSTDMLITGHYWDTKFPKLFSSNQINEFKNLKIIGDITCDINGSIPTTIRSTSIAKPYYSIDINSMKEIDLSNKGIAVMAVDNLPSELPREASEEFGNSIMSEVLPYLINKDDGRINRATTASKGKLCPQYSYLENFIHSSDS